MNPPPREPKVPNYADKQMRSPLEYRPNTNDIISDTDHEQSPNQRPGVWWKQFQTIQLLLGCILGLCVGIAHHFYYAYLDGRAANSQSWVLRSGTAISFAVKLLWSTSIGVAFSQRVWQTLRSKSFSIQAVDGVFSLRNDATKFFSKEILTQAKVASSVAAMSWALTLIPILIPGSISVVAKSHVQNHSGVSVPSLNFSNPITTVQRVGDTEVFTLQMADTPGIGALSGNYLKASSPIVSFISNTLYGKQIADIPSPCGANCSFAQSFIGPAYKCEDVDFTRNDTAENPFCINSNSGFGACGGAFDDVYFNPFDTTWYEARNSSGDICDGVSDCSSQVDAWYDGKLWVLYQYLLPQYRNENDQGSNSTPIPPEAWERHVFVCQSYNATYQLQRSYVNFQHTVNGTLDYLNPINYTSLKGSDAELPEAYAAYAIHQTLYSLLSGSIMPDGQELETDSTGLAMSGLVQDLPFPAHSVSPLRATWSQKPVRYLSQAIQDLHFNVTVGLLSLTPNLAYSQEDTVEVQLQHSDNVWSYDWHVLVVAYGIAAVLNAAIVALGIFAMISNGGCSGIGFVRILATTKASPRLDGVVDGWNNGMDPVPDKVKNVNIMFREAEGTRQRTGFRVVGES